MPSNFWLARLPGLARGLGEFAPPSATTLLHGNSPCGTSDVDSGVNNSCALPLVALSLDATSSLAGISNTNGPLLGPALPSSSCLCVLASSALPEDGLSRTSEGSYDEEGGIAGFSSFPSVV
jgi:hypothetical protein